jgi:hypothetical protein
MKKILLIPVIFVMIIIVSACRQDASPFVYPYQNEDLITIERGIWGNVWFWEGYFNTPEDFGKITPVERDIHIFRRIHFDSMDNYKEYPFFSYVDADFIAAVRSDYNGFYQIELDSGDYSLFIFENDKYYAVEVNDSGFVQSCRLNNDRDSLRMKTLNITTAATFSEF